MYILKQVGVAQLIRDHIPTSSTTTKNVHTFFLIFSIMKKERKMYIFLKVICLGTWDMSGVMDILSNCSSYGFRETETEKIISQKMT